MSIIDWELIFSKAFIITFVLSTSFDTTVLALTVVTTLHLSREQFPEGRTLEVANRTLTVPELLVRDGEFQV